MKIRVLKGLRLSTKTLRLMLSPLKTLVKRESFRDWIMCYSASEVL